MPPPPYPMLHTPLAQITTLLAAGVTAWAVVAGRWPERIAGVCIALDWAAGVLLQDRRPHHHAQPAIFAVDLCTFAILVFLVVRCRRTWVLWAAACALLIVMTHVGMMLDTSITQWSFLTASYVWSLGVLAALAGGMAFEAKRDVAPLWGGPERPA